MRITILLIAFITGLDIYGQTDSIEKAIFYDKLKSKEISNIDFSTIGNKWNATIKKENYPELSLNNNGKIQYSFIIEFQDMIKDNLFNRVLEWFSITYGIIPAYLYSNFKDGKIICSSSININDNTSVTYTYIITVKDSKLLMEFTNIGYLVTKAGYNSYDTWIPEKTNYFNIDQVFPIILKDPSEWNYYFNILKTMDKHFNNDINSLNEYILNYDLRYLF